MNPVRSLAAVLALAGPICAGIAPPVAAAPVSSLDAEACAALATVTYYAAGADLSRADRRRLVEAKRDASRPLKTRPAVEAARIVDAEFRGGTSHGNHGAGLTNLDAARGDGLSAALTVQAECLQAAPRAP